MEYGYECHCSDTPTRGIARRDFFKATAAGSLGLVGAAALGARAAGAAEHVPPPGLFDPGETRVYRGLELEHIAMPMGGVGAGQLYLRGDGSLGPWQIFNNFNSSADADGAFFAIRARQGDRQVARLLRGTPLADLPAVTAVEFSGEYPFAWLRYFDGQLPVDVQMESYCPFIPLNEKDSALPAVVFTFRITNRSAEAVDGALLASMPNLVGWDGYAPLPEEHAHPEFWQNRNGLTQTDGATTLVMRREAGEGHTLADAREFHTDDWGVAYAMRHCQNLKVFHNDAIPRPENAGESAVFWLRNLQDSAEGAALDVVLDAVQRGAGLVLAINAADLTGLLETDADSAAIVFEDWESGTWGNWAIEGDCFGVAPAAGTLPGQQKVSGFRGNALCNTFVNGDATSGRAVSKPFTIAHPYIHLLVGGGNHRGETCVNLVIDGTIAATATGQNTERLRPVRWDVAAHTGKTATIEIVDRNTGGWGHILVDDIVFSNSPVSPYVSPELIARLREASPAEPKKDGLRPKANAELVGTSVDGAPLAIAGAYGEGRVVLCIGGSDALGDGVALQATAGSIVAIAGKTQYQAATGLRPDSPLYGTMALAALNAPENSESAAQWSDLASLWEAFASGQKLAAQSDAPSEAGKTWSGALSVPYALGPSESREFSFAIAWHFPNRWRTHHYGWGPPPFQYDYRLGNQYNNWFGDAGGVVSYLSSNLERLSRETRLFHDTFYASSLPRYYLDAITANISIIRSPIYVWLEDGTVGGFEGADSCCPMNCTHVYNYAMSTAYMFPALERNVRETDLLVQMHPEEHYIPHRTKLPLSLPRLGFEIGGPHHPALDGELGTILKTYREYLLSGDKDWLAKMYEPARTHMRYLCATHDPDGDGLIKGEQPNTYDTHLYGSNTFIGTLYLAALRASEEMARVMDDAGFAEECRERFEKSSRAYDKTCWNGEYYYNVYDAPEAEKDPNLYNHGNCYGPGCHADQLFGQWWAHMLRLGHVLPEKHVRQAMESMFNYCWKADLSDHEHHQRVFAEGRERGLLNCTWPNGGRPENPILYCDEVWTGIEYHVAATLLVEGMVEQAFEIVLGARDRYTGDQRNPWAEIECGHHYSRAMSSYSLMTAAAGLHYDGQKAALHFAPRVSPAAFTGFFTMAGGWGTASQQRDALSQRNTLRLAYGESPLARLTLEMPVTRSAKPRIAAAVNGSPTPCDARLEGQLCHLTFPDGVILRPDAPLDVLITWE